MTAILLATESSIRAARSRKPAPTVPARVRTKPGIAMVSDPEPKAPARSHPKRIRVLNVNTMVADLSANDTAASTAASTAGWAAYNAAKAKPVTTPIILATAGNSVEFRPSADGQTVQVIQSGSLHSNGVMNYSTVRLTTAKAREMYRNLLAAGYSRW